MKMTIDAMFAKSIMKEWNRDYYTTTALEAIFDYYDEIDDSTEFDPILICCDWHEYGDNCALTLSDLFDDYGYKLDNINEYEFDDDKMENKIKIFLATLVAIIGVEMGSGLITTIQAYSDGLNQQINIAMTIDN